MILNEHDDNTDNRENTKVLVIINFFEFLGKRSGIIRNFKFEDEKKLIEIEVSLAGGVHRHYSGTISAKP